MLCLFTSKNNKLASICLLKFPLVTLITTLELHLEISSGISSFKSAIKRNKQTFKLIIVPALDEIKVTEKYFFGIRKKNYGLRIALTGLPIQRNIFQFFNFNKLEELLLIMLFVTLHEMNYKQFFSLTLTKLPT